MNCHTVWWGRFQFALASNDNVCLSNACRTPQNHDAFLTVIHPLSIFANLTPGVPSPHNMQMKSQLGTQLGNICMEPIPNPYWSQKLKHVSTGIMVLLWCPGIILVSWYCADITVLHWYNGIIGSSRNYTGILVLYLYHGTILIARHFTAITVYHDDYIMVLCWYHGIVLV